MNINEFAKLCGVSPATASRFFSGNAALSPERSEHIRRLAEETGYQPSKRYQRRKAGGNGPIVALIPYLHHRYQVDLLSELQRYAGSLQRQMLILCESESERVQQCIPLIRSINSAGLVLLHEGSDGEFSPLLGVPAIPMVLCSALSVTKTISSVHIDDLAAAYDGARYLIGCGHTSIAVISDQAEAIGSGSLRIMGCQKAFLDAGLQLDDDRIVHAWYSFADGYAAMNRLLDRKIRFTAVFVLSDEMAAGAMAALHDRGIKVPEEISVLGFDNGYQALEIRPLLTTVGQPLEQIACRSIDILLAGNCTAAPESIVLPHTLVERQSCRRL